MSPSINNDPKKTINLFGLQKKFNFLAEVFDKKKMPQILMLSGEKGIGKFTLINHLLNYVYDKSNYDFKKNVINLNSEFNKQYLNGIFSNIVYLTGSHFKNVKIDDVRNLKSIISKSSILNKERFIIFDEVELFNANSLNALLKIIEEPSSNNFFVLINSKSKPLLQTISSRTLEIRIILNNEERIEIIESIIKDLNLEILIDYKITNLSPGNFLVFNEICKVNKIDISANFLSNFEKLIILYKKTKNYDLINLIMFLTNYYFHNLSNSNKENIDKIYENKVYVIDNINDFITYNLNQNSLINAINNKLSDE